MKKVFKSVSTILTIFTTLSMLTVCKAAASKPPKVCIESPANGSYISGSRTAIKGFSLFTSGVKSVAIYINGKKAGNAKIGIRRDDINRKYNSSGAYKGARYSGFSYLLNTSSYLPGTYKITALSTSKSGTICKVSTNIKKAVKKAAPRIHIDSPKEGSSFNTDFTIKGWSLNASGVSKVTVAVDGKAVGSAQIGLSRADINKNLNASGCYKGAAQSGFLYKVKSGSLSAGTHTFTVTSHGNDRSTVSANLTAKIMVPKPQAYILTPKDNNEYIRDTLTVNGWSASADGVKSVQVYIDNKPVGSAQIGLSNAAISSKITVNNAYKNAASSGYSLTVTDLSSYKTGEHTVKVISTGNNGDTATCESKVTKAAPITGFDSTNLTVSNSNFTISGYALNATGVSIVELYYGSTLLGTATPNLESADIQKKYDKDGIKYTGSSQSRFNLNVNINSMPYGNDKVTAKAIGSDGEISTVSATVKVTKPLPLGCIDTPANGQNFTYSDTDMVVSGWMLNASGVASITVYLDDQQIDGVTTGLASGAGVIARAGGNYIGAENARFTTDSIDISGLSCTKHTVKVVAVGNDGSVYQIIRTFYKSAASNTTYNISLSTMAADNKVPTSLVDPNVIESADGAGMYEFMKLNYVNGITAADLNKMLEKCGVLKGKGQIFLDAGKEYNINPVYLIAHARVESGNGTSKLSVGVKVKAGTYKVLGKNRKIAAGTYYNQFGINAVDTAPISQGSLYAAANGWNSVDASIKGGASWIASTYIWGGSPNQDTLYKMRFDPGYWDGTYKHCYEYATSKTWAHSIAEIIAQYSDILNGIQLSFDIPQYK